MEPYILYNSIQRRHIHTHIPHTGNRVTRQTLRHDEKSYEGEKNSEKWFKNELLSTGK